MLNSAAIILIALISGLLLTVCVGLVFNLPVLYNVISRIEGSLRK